MGFPGDYFASSEGHVADLPGFVEAVRQISAFQLNTGSRFVWRGVANADHELYSSLPLRLRHQTGLLPTEDELQAAELAILEEAREWSLDWHAGGGRLSALELLAALQHYGTPTRLLDFTYNPLVALWFAVEKHDALDGRVFAVDIADRQIARSNSETRDPWWTLNPPHNWQEYSWIWRPPPFEARIVRQDGCFLVGGIPGTVPGRNVKVRGKWRLVSQAEVQATMSLPISLIQFEHAVAASEGRRLPGRQPSRWSAFTLRVTGKRELRTELERGWGHTHASIYPDFSGFARHAKSIPPQ